MPIGLKMSSCKLGHLINDGARAKRLHSYEAEVVFWGFVVMGDSVAQIL